MFVSLGQFAKKFKKNTRFEDNLQICIKILSRIYEDQFYSKANFFAPSPLRSFEHSPLRLPSTCVLNVQRSFSIP